MKGFRIFLALLAMILAIFSLFSVAIGLINIVGGSPGYGSQRSVASFLFFALSSAAAYFVWPRETESGAGMIAEYHALPDSRSRVDFIASAAAARLGISSEEYSLLLTKDLNFTPRNVMDLWEELAEEFGIDLSAEDFPDVNSIDGLRERLSS